MRTNKIIVVYYGIILLGRNFTQEARRLLNVSADGLLINRMKARGGENVNARVLEALHKKYEKIFAYVPTDFAKRKLSEVVEESISALKFGFDGIFFDEVMSPMLDTQEYYSTLSNAVRERDGTVIFNPGRPGTTEKIIRESIMQLTDILCLSNYWRKFCRAVKWREKYRANRFMGISCAAASKEFSPMNLGIARKFTKEAWKNRIGWHYSTTNYIELPSWFEEYITS